MKRLAASVLVLAFVVMGSGLAVGATDTAKLSEIKSLYQQMYTIRLQIIDKQVEAGILDKDKAEKIKGFMQERQKKLEEAVDNGELPRFGKDKGLRHKKGTQQQPKTAPSSMAE